MSFVASINGTLFDATEARIPVLDRGFLYGDSVYEVVRTYEGEIFALREHMNRLENSAQGLGLEMPPISGLVDDIRKTIAAVNSPDCYCRIVVTRGSGPLTLDPTTASNPVTVVLAKPYEPFPEWTYTDGIRVAVPTIRRTARSSLDPAIKSGNYLNSVLALAEAKKAGFTDALMLDHTGLVTEATSSNVFILKGNALFTPSLECGLLAGVTRRLLMGLAERNGYECEERSISLQEVLEADEVMLTSTLREVQPVVQVEKRVIGNGKPGKNTIHLKQLYHDFALRYVRSEENWYSGD